MKTVERKMRTLSWVMLGVALALAGCESEDTDTDITATRFNVKQELKSYSAQDNFTWETTLSRVTATIRIKDFTHGDAMLRVYDDHGKVLLSSLLATPNNTIYTGGNDFVVTRGSASGTPGTWRVELAYDDFTGEIEVTLE